MSKPITIQFFDGGGPRASAASSAGPDRDRDETLAEHTARVRREIKAAQSRAKVRRAMEASSARQRAEARASLALSAPPPTDSQRQTDALIERERRKQAEAAARLREQARLTRKPLGWGYLGPEAER